MDDAIARYRAATEANDIDAIMATMAPDVELISPISGRMVFRGQDDVRHVFKAVYSTLKDLRWKDEVGDGSLRVVTGGAKVGPVRLGDAMILELADDGRIRRVSPHLRPWLGLTVFALLLGPKVARHPGSVRRALRSA